MQQSAAQVDGLFPSAHGVGDTLDIGKQNEVERESPSGNKGSR